MKAFKLGTALLLGAMFIGCSQHSAPTPSSTVQVQDQVLDNSRATLPPTDDDAEDEEALQEAPLPVSAFDPTPFLPLANQWYPFIPGGGGGRFRGRCGDGVVRGSEQCDQGTQNSDTIADACRTNCTNARCG